MPSKKRSKRRSTPQSQSPPTPPSTPASGAQGTPGTPGTPESGEPAAIASLRLLNQRLLERVQQAELSAERETRARQAAEATAEAAQASAAAARAALSAEAAARMSAEAATREVRVAVGLKEEGLCTSAVTSASSRGEEVSRVRPRSENAVSTVAEDGGIWGRIIEVLFGSIRKVLEWLGFVSVRRDGFGEDVPLLVSSV